MQSLNYYLKNELSKDFPLLAIKYRSLKPEKKSLLKEKKETIYKVLSLPKYPKMEKIKASMYKFTIPILHVNENTK
ncbi:MAG: hypothetical protein LBS15_00685 [Endomicrobium sp.]|jgi:hypothetical protein|nr:hypothetical protein [Endomicrobium sp.]